MNVSRSLAALMILATMSGSSLRAETDQGRIAGTVRDQSDAVASGTAVRVKNERTGEERTTVTNENGYFLVGSLKPSTYTVAVEGRGFAPVEYTAMPLGVGQELTLDF